MKAKYKILNKDPIGMFYTVEGPDGRTMELQKNIRRNILIGKNSRDFSSSEAFYYYNEKDFTIELERAKMWVDIGNYVKVQFVATLREGDKVMEDWLHRMVAYSWIPGYDSKRDDVDHINRNKQDNRVENLRAVNPIENSFKELKAKNPRGAEYMREAMGDGFRNQTAEDYERAFRQTLESNNHIVFNTVSDGLSESELKTLMDLRAKVESNRNKK